MVCLLWPHVISDAFVFMSSSKCYNKLFSNQRTENEEFDATKSLSQSLNPVTLPRALNPSNLQMPIDPMLEEHNNLKPAALIETIGGGTSLIFEMARRMLVWDESERQSKPLPRWHPHSGVSDVNPSFRTKSPIMNNQGYASTIWRNVRKKNKPSLWRYALRTYDRMEDAAKESKTSMLRIERSWIHHEGALLACAKLGYWKEAIAIFQNVKAQESSKGGVTDNMIFSIVKAAVRGSKSLKASEASLLKRRKPLDEVRTVLNEMEWRDFPIRARHMNPLAAAYLSLGLLEDAQSVLQDNLGNRTIGPEPEFGLEALNVNDLSAKDKASYALLVKGAIASGSWTTAVDALEDMTEAGFYPNQSHLNQWAEVSERKMKQRASRSWKKKRDVYWLESVRLNTGNGNMS
jgi:pentatricopeptide repeat protein